MRVRKFLPKIRVREVLFIGKPFPTCILNGEKKYNYLGIALSFFFGIKMRSFEPSKSFSLLSFFSATIPNFNRFSVFSFDGPEICFIQLPFTERNSGEFESQT
jgi:hypothetical protein